MHAAVKLDANSRRDPANEKIQASHHTHTVSHENYYNIKFSIHVTRILRIAYQNYSNLLLEFKVFSEKITLFFFSNYENIGS